MKKFLPIIIIVAVVLVGAGAYMLVQKKDGSADINSTSVKDNSVKTVANKHKDACKLFTKEEIATALGGTFGDGEEEIAFSTATPGSDNYEELKGSACKFDQDNDGTTKGMTEALTLSLAINNYATTEDADRYMKNLHDPQTAEGKEAVNKHIDVDGVGDQAFFVKLNVTSGIQDKTEALNVRVGKQVIVLTATKLAGLDHQAVQDALTTLAKKL